MSQINTNAILDASGGTTATVNGFTPTVSNMAGRNRIINGDMRIDQRNAGAAVTFDTAGTYLVDRWTQNNPSGCTITGQQSTTAPDGFTNSLLITATSGGAPATSNLRIIRHKIEGFNVADLAWGTSSAKPVTLSFWVRSNVTGTFASKLGNSGFVRSQVKTFSISAANTWEHKTLTFSGDTAGTWLTNNGIGIELSFDLGSGSDYNTTADAWQSGFFTRTSGSVNFSNTTSNNFYITGVQLEAGSVATPFCPAGGGSYSAELALCQRYYYQSACALGSTADDYEWMYSLNLSAQYKRTTIRHPVTMRSAPTIGSLTIRLNDASTVSTIAQYITKASFSPVYNTSSSSDYVAVNGYTVSAEL